MCMYVFVHSQLSSNDGLLESGQEEETFVHSAEAEAKGTGHHKQQSFFSKSPRIDEYNEL